MADKKAVVELRGNLTLNEVDCVAQLLLAHISGEDWIAVDLSAIAALDGAGLQTLIAARYYALTQGTRWRVVGWSPTLAKVLDDLRCADLLDGTDEQFKRGKWGHLISGPLAPQKLKSVEGHLPMENECWHLSIRFGVGAFLNGSDPLRFLGQVRCQGEIARVKLIHSNLPRLPDLLPRDCYLGLEVDLRARTRPEFVSEAGVYVFGSLPPFAPEEAYRNLLYRLPEDPRRTALDLWEMGSVTDRELERLLPPFGPPDGEMKRNREDRGCANSNVKQLSARAS